MHPSQSMRRSSARKRGTGAMTRRRRRTIITSTMCLLLIRMRTTHSWQSSSPTLLSTAVRSNAAAASRMKSSPTSTIPTTSTSLNSYYGGRRRRAGAVDIRTAHSIQEQQKCMIQQQPTSMISSLAGWQEEWLKCTARRTVCFIMIMGILLFSPILLVQTVHADDDDHGPSVGPAATSMTTSPSSSTTTRNSNLPYGKRYWTIMESGTTIERQAANEALLDYGLGLINMQFYDNTGGATFEPHAFYQEWKTFQKSSSTAAATNHHHHHGKNTPHPNFSSSSSGGGGDGLADREVAMEGLHYLVQNLHDPFSKYLTRDELRQELEATSNGFLGIGAIVEAPPIVAFKSSSSSSSSSSSLHTTPPQEWHTMKPFGIHTNRMNNSNNNVKNKKFLTTTKVENVPVVTAVAPDSPAERAGLVVGDRIVAVGDQTFLGSTRDKVAHTLQSKRYYMGEEYFGHATLTVAKPVFAAAWEDEKDDDDDYSKVSNDAVASDPQVLGGASSSSSSKRTNAQQRERNVVLAYRPTKVIIPTSMTEPFRPASRSIVAGGDSIVHYELLTSKSGSIFDHLYDASSVDDAAVEPKRRRRDDYKVGYVRLTRFSKVSTAGYVKALEELDAAGAQSYIIDLRNNYGGIIQEAMLTASTLLRDPHSVMCFTMNSKGGFTPHDVEEFIVDQRFPGYLLSKEAKSVTMDKVRRDNPAMFLDSGLDWRPPSAFASLHEQAAKRGIRRVSYNEEGVTIQPTDLEFQRQARNQKNIVLLINEGTASSAEVFTAALHDNGRTVAVVGTKSFGKGLIQHTFPMPDGGGMRLTVAEYLTPALQHVTLVGNARFDQTTGELIGGGIQPDISCESRQGIPGNIQGDLCVGVALDALQEAMDERGPLA